MINIDTDKLIPKQFLKTIKRTGLGQYLFNEIRFNADGSENKDFILNKPAYRDASILIAGDNFGCGSSREHAPWALLDFGVKCVISTSFADIFFNNCFKNGILPIVVSKEQLDQLMDDANNGANSILDIDLENQQIGRPNGDKINFEIDEFRKHCLINGLDDIGLTMQKQDSIGDFEKRREIEQPWV
jgi:3-isopropylmalate/(R)-2-methylmalate dehydratase small subunit